MSLSAIELTQFNVEKLNCIGGAGRAAPYRITLYRGMELGSTGEVMPSAMESSNESNFEQTVPGLLRRILSAFNL